MPCRVTELVLVVVGAAMIIVIVAVVLVVVGIANAAHVGQAGRGRLLSHASFAHSSRTRLPRTAFACAGAPALIALDAVLL